MSAQPLDPAGIRKWAAGVNKRLDAIEAPRTLDGLPIRVRTEGPLTEPQLAARMVRNGASEADAVRDAAAIFGRWR